MHAPGGTQLNGGRDGRPLAARLDWAPRAAAGVLLLFSVGLSGCGLGDNLRRAIVASRYVARGNELLATGDPRAIHSARLRFDKACDLRPDDPQLARLLVMRYV
ncbi:MAG: hypothetical protein ACE5JM_13100, partial [Armatimonadota bacterium]